MPTAGEEGYEDTVICPYDKSHEIRRGRIQFHLNKCREGRSTNKVKEECPFNKTHIVPVDEIPFHTEEECGDRGNWDRTYEQVGEENCPVEGLVDINAASVPDGEENWDEIETQGSVLSTIKEEATKKTIFRNLQCESKATRRNFREAEKQRHSELQNVNSFPDQLSDSERTPDNVPLRKPVTPFSSLLSLKRQDPREAEAVISHQFRSMDINMKPSPSSSSFSDTSSMINTVVPSTIEQSITTAPTPSEAQFSDYLSVVSASTSQAMSSRPSTAANIENSANRYRQGTQADLFCNLPIPGIGRGRRPKSALPQ